jgi:uncharacterized PurR-regulated membrane protein YhhQ (DUF165 family)
MALSPLLALTAMTILFWLVIASVNYFGRRIPVSEVRREFLFSSLLGAILTIALFLSLGIGLFMPRFWELSRWNIINVGTVLIVVQFFTLNVYTEIYGFDRARRCLSIAAVAGGVLLAITITVQVVRLASSPGIRVSVASLIAFLVSAYVNSVILSVLKRESMKDADRQKRAIALWVRHLATSIVSLLLDSVLFFSLAFPIGDRRLVVSRIGLNWGFKILMTAPLLFVALTLVIPRLKLAERREVVDDAVSYWPLGWGPNRGRIVSTLPSQ